MVVNTGVSFLKTKAAAMTRDLWMEHRKMTALASEAGPGTIPTAWRGLQMSLVMASPLGEVVALYFPVLFHFSIEPSLNFIGQTIHAYYQSTNEVRKSHYSRLFA